MTINWTYLVCTWVFLAAAVITLAIYRNLVARSEDDSLHVRESDASLVGQQVSLGRKLAALDRWGEIFTIVVVILGILLAAAYLYSNLQNSSKIPAY
jgi:protein-S-isoprenylcysteine O-methyltransferase Ste14